MSTETLKLLDQLNEGQQMSQIELDEFLSKHHSEDLYLEYKHGGELTDRRKAARTIRQYLSGFANSEGGVLFVGVDETSWSVASQPALGGGDLAQWASRCLDPIAPYFSPVPRFSIVKHERGDVLIASTARSLGLVPCLEEGKIVYYFRFHDETLEAPEYLVSDLLLGRRQGPYLHITKAELTLRSDLNLTDAESNLVITPRFEVENGSPSWAEATRLGMVSLADRHPSWERGLSSYLLRYIDVKEPDRKRFGKCSPVYSSISGRLEPFEVAADMIFPEHRSPLWKYQHRYTPYNWKAALYVMAQGIHPSWYQLCLVINEELVRILEQNAPGASTCVSSGSSFVELRRLSGERPVVAWDSI